MVMENRPVDPGSIQGSVTVYRLPIRLPQRKRRKKEEASPKGKNRAMWGEEAKRLKHKNDAERKSDLTKINEIGVAGRYPVHTLCL